VKGISKEAWLLNDVKPSLAALRAIVSRKERQGFAKVAKCGVLLCVLSETSAAFAGNFRRKSKPLCSEAAVLWQPLWGCVHPEKT